MIYTDFQNEKLSMPGFDTMRLPTTDSRSTRHNDCFKKDAAQWRRL
ncbi:MAG: hypothetical protein ACI3YH_01590 [Eubacteriales bacterium]